MAIRIAVLDGNNFLIGYQEVETLSPGQVDMTKSDLPANGTYEWRAAVGVFFPRATEIRRDEVTELEDAFIDLVDHVETLGALPANLSSKRSELQGKKINRRLKIRGN